MQRSPLRFSRLSNVKSLGFNVLTVPASSGTDALMFTARTIAIDVAYQGIFARDCGRGGGQGNSDGNSDVNDVGAWDTFFSLYVFSTSGIHVTLLNTLARFSFGRSH